ncbi:MAG: radical SAM protein [Clostridia bacterium]|nr:radical SAM protein [Clostridia bacterium]
MCSLCPRNCYADRVSRLGFCQSGWLPKVARAALHFGEEPCICGTRGSGAIFFSGCSLRCRYCQNYGISHEGFGKEISLERLREIYRELLTQGAHNINLVTASHFVSAILASLSDKPDTTFVFNCSGYESVSTLQSLYGKIDVYMPDFKYAYDALGKRYSSVSDYTSTALTAIEEMVGQTGKPVFDEDGLLRHGVLVRHLVLPGHLKNSRRVIDFLSEKYGDRIVFSLMGQYTPTAQVCGTPPLNRPLFPEEYEEICDYLSESGLTLGYTQELSSADARYIPDFDLTGV